MSLAIQTLLRASRESLSPVHARNLLAAGGQLVDVRSPADFQRNALPGAMNLPMDAISWKHRSLNRRRPVILCGGTGVHCQQAAQLLAGRGFSNIYHLMLN